MEREMIEAILQMVVMAALVAALFFFTRPKVKPSYSLTFGSSEIHLLIVMEHGEPIMVWHNDGRFSSDLDGNRPMSAEVAAEIWRRWRDAQVHTRETANHD